MKVAVADRVAWLRYAVVGYLSLTDAVIVNSAADLSHHSSQDQRFTNRDEWLVLKRALNPLVKEKETLVG